MQNMKMQLKEILVLNDVLRAIIDNDKDLKIDVLFKFKLLGIMKSIEIPVENFDVIRKEKIKEYGKKDEDGNISIPQDDYDAIKKFTDDLNKVVLSDIDVNIEKISAKDAFCAGVPAEYLVKLYGIIEK